MSPTFHSIQRWVTQFNRDTKLHTLGGLLVLLILTGGCHKGADSTIAPPPVTVSHPISQPVTEYLDLTGTTAASRTVDLMARVSGYLESVNFQDGAFVEKGQLLFVIEPPPYEQQVALNEAVTGPGPSRVRPPAGVNQTKRDLDLQRREMAEHTGPGPGAGRAGEDQSWLHSRYGAVRRAHRPTFGRPGQPCRHGQPDQARHARSTPADLRQLQPERARRASDARGDAQARHGSEVSRWESPRRGRAEQRERLSARRCSRFCR